ncbi:MAG: DUF3592 domain-containing protein [Anaerolineales bacterium]|nr:DUF3592 domain-containing protein [Anaerolineales bacterium]
MPPKPSTQKRSQPTSLGCSLVFNLLWIAIGVLIEGGSLIVYRNNLAVYERLSREGVSTTATILKLELERRGSQKTHRITTHKVYYQFTGNVNGSPVKFEDVDTISQALYLSLQTGQKIEILYAASDPTLSVVKEDFAPPSLVFTMFVTVVAGLFAVMGLVSMAKAIDH